MSALALAQPALPALAPDVIDRFAGPYAWLSNGDPSPVQLGRFTAATVEHAFNAAKTLDMAQRAWVIAAPAPFGAGPDRERWGAKRRGHHVTLRPGWDAEIPTERLAPGQAPVLLKVAVMQFPAAPEVLRDPRARAPPAGHRRRRPHRGQHLARQLLGSLHRAHAARGLPSLLPRHLRAPRRQLARSSADADPRRAGGPVRAVSRRGVQHGLDLHVRRPPRGGANTRHQHTTVRVAPHYLNSRPRLPAGP
jgi:hypothetical protein